MRRTKVAREWGLAINSSRARYVRRGRVLTCTGSNRVGHHSHLEGRIHYNDGARWDEPINILLKHRQLLTPWHTLPNIITPCHAHQLRTRFWIWTGLLDFGPACQSKMTSFRKGFWAIWSDLFSFPGSVTFQDMFQASEVSRFATGFAPPSWGAELQSCVQS